jgi:hypothetical protein
LKLHRLKHWVPEACIEGDDTARFIVFFFQTATVAKTKWHFRAERDIFKTPGHGVDWYTVSTYKGLGA